MTHIKRIDEMANAAKQGKDLFGCDTVKVELSSLTYCCKFGNENEEELIKTNRYIFGKTVDTFEGNDYEIEWDIDINTGTIKGWDSGKVEIYFKVVDGGRYTLLEHGKVLAQKTDYVPFFLQIDENGFNDYVQITVDENGRIKDWDGEKRKMQIIGYFQDNELPIGEYTSAPKSRKDTQHRYVMSWSQADNGWMVVYARDIKEAEMKFEDGDYTIEDED